MSTRLVSAFETPAQPAVIAQRLTRARAEEWILAKARLPEVPPIPNPYHLVARRDVILNAITELMGS